VPGDRVRFLTEPAVRAAVAALCRREVAALRALVPGADVQHVGSTAVPGSLTKGDLHLQVRVPAEHFAAAEAALAEAYPRNPGSMYLPGVFAAFERKGDIDEPRRGASIDLGVQLTAIDGEVDVFWRFREVLLARPDLAAEYDALKRRHEGAAMSAYRTAKDSFFARLRSEPEFAAAQLPE
jgi:GrpB-like predicted nucleotidyltransferase (UPF0157 family)